MCGHSMKLIISQYVLTIEFCRNNIARWFCVNQMLKKNSSKEKKRFENSELFEFKWIQNFIKNSGP